MLRANQEYYVGTQMAAGIDEMESTDYHAVSEFADIASKTG